MSCVVTAADRDLFRRCLRAWDLGARMRSSYEPLERSNTVRLDQALRSALRVYYFPGMWSWSRDVVRPLAIRELDASLAECDDEDRALGRHSLECYFEWAPALDTFSSIRADTPFEVSVPDPDQEGCDLVTRTGETVRYQGRIDLLVTDSAGENWIVEHCIRRASSAASPDPERDERAATHCATWEMFFLGMTIAGSIYNEIDVDASAASEPSPFRRVVVRRSPQTLSGARRRLALEARAMVEAARSPGPLPPSLSRENCAYCDYRRPCITLSERRDVAPILEGGYRKRAIEAVPEPGLAGRGTWGPALSARSRG